MEFVDEAQIYKCSKHPSRRRKSGICPKCLRDRLVTLCPNCAVALPCPSCPPPLESASSSSSSSSSSFSLFSFSRGGSRHDFTTSSSQNGSSSTTNNPLDQSDPVLRKSRSVAIPFLRSRSRYVGNQVNINELHHHGNVVAHVVAAEISSDKQPVVVDHVPQKVHKSSKISFRSMFMLQKSKKPDTHQHDIIEKKAVKNNFDTTTKDVNNNNSPMMTRNRSVAVGSGNDFGLTNSKIEDTNNSPMMLRTRSVAVGGGNGLVPGSSKPKGWYFPSPMKSFRHPKPLNSVAVA
uniref:uncharacterized protein LOC122585109 n=1 Tax=Erigeron canadensis TaxID=72917 RepID=UPI001CB8FB1C|nr:uncharacterized protein LOC122585109 [Erigeron canadensis]